MSKHLPENKDVSEMALFGFVLFCFNLGTIGYWECDWPS